MLIIPKLPFINKSETITFYNAMGFEMFSDYDDYFLTKKDKSELHFFAFPKLDPKKSDFMLYIRLDDGINEIYSLYQSKEVLNRGLRPLEHQPWGMIEFSLIDPNGTCFTFGQSI